jgi:hypothetical protein
MDHFGGALAGLLSEPGRWPALATTCCVDTATTLASARPKEASPTLSNCTLCMPARAIARD